MPGGNISMLCYKNGALAREQIRDCYAAGDWDRFNQLVEVSPPGNNGYMGLYFPLPEIIPPNVIGDFFFSFGCTGHPRKATLVDTIPVSAHPRAILESQLLSIRSRIAAILPENAQPLQRLVITGGSSTNQTILQLAADLFGMRVYVTTELGSKEASCTGGAILAKYAWCRQMNVGPFGEMGPNRLKCVAEPTEVSKVYDRLLEVYRDCEEEVVRRQRPI